MSTIAMSGLYEPHLQQQILGRAALPHDLEALAGEQTRDALAQEHRVVGKGDTYRRLGLLGIRAIGVDVAHCRRKSRR